MTWFLLAKQQRERQQLPLPAHLSWDSAPRPQLPELDTSLRFQGPSHPPNFVLDFPSASVSLVMLCDPRPRVILLHWYTAVLQLNGNLCSEIYHVSMPTNSKRQPVFLPYSLSASFNSSVPSLFLSFSPFLSSCFHLLSFFSFLLNASCSIQLCMCGHALSSV